MSIREFKFEFDGPGGTIELYIHDNNDHELLTVPPLTSDSVATEQIRFLTEVAVFCRRRKISKLEVTKVP